MHYNSSKNIKKQIIYILSYNSLSFVVVGRAWLYQALSDQLLESYIRCYMDNVKLVRSFYMQDALVLDYQVPRLLLSHTFTNYFCHFHSTAVFSR